MTRFHDCARPTTGNCSLILACLVIGLSGCGGPKTAEAIAPFDANQGEKRKEMRLYMETHKQEASKPRPQRNHP